MFICENCVNATYMMSSVKDDQRLVIILNENPDLKKIQACYGKNLAAFLKRNILNNDSNKVKYEINIILEMRRP